MVGLKTHIRAQGEDIVCAISNNGTSSYDVGPSHPPAEAGGKGLAVRQLKRHASWVQNVSYIAFYRRNAIQ